MRCPLLPVDDCSPTDGSTYSKLIRRSYRNRNGDVSFLWFFSEGSGSEPSEKFWRQGTHLCPVAKIFVGWIKRLLPHSAPDGAPVRCASWLSRNSHLKAQSRQTGALTIPLLLACCQNRRMGQGLWCPAWKR